MEGFTEGIEGGNGLDDGLKPEGEGVIGAGEGIGTDGEAEGVAGGLAKGLAHGRADAVCLRAGGGNTEGDALDGDGTEEVDIVVGEAVAAAADEDAGVAGPGDEADGGEGLVGEPEGSDGAGGSGFVEEVFEGSGDRFQASMVLRSDMRIESVDLFYLSMPEVLDIGDGSQDALLVRVRAGEWTGWGECEAAPLPSIASFVCPMSHSACKPVGASVMGQRVETAADIRRIGDLVRAESLDLLQADHTLSGIDMALWDLLGKKTGEPVYRLLGYEQAYAKLPYASMLFGDTAEQTFEKARGVRLRAAKFGWGPIGKGTAEEDAAHFRAAREGLGPDRRLLVDIGTVWGEDVERAAQALPALEECGAVWLEEPFVSGALEAYAALARRARTVKMAAGEGSHNLYMARHLVDHAGLGYLQIDAGRIGGISVAKEAADYAARRGVTYVNHTFTSHLALAASLAPFAGLAGDEICEYPVEPKALALAVTANHLTPDAEGLLRVPEGPGLGMTVDTAGLRPYLVDCEIRAGGKVLYRTPEIGE